MEILRVVGPTKEQKLPQFPVTYTEYQPKRCIEIIVASVDKVLNNVGQPRIAGERVGYCGIVSDLTKRAAERAGIQADIFQVRDIHRMFGGEKYRAFGHVFNLVRVAKESYLVDGTFGQFFNPKTQFLDMHEPGGGSAVVVGPIKDYPIATELLEKGYVNLTDESLRDYLRATVKGEKSYVERANVEAIRNNPSLPLEYMEYEDQLDLYLDNKEKFLDL